MCGRFTLRASPVAVAAEFELGTLPLFLPRYNIAPTQPVAIVRLPPARLSPAPLPASTMPAAAATTCSPREWAIVRWGLVPSWAEDLKMGSRLINARSETVAEKPSFRAAFRRRRCLIPLDGYYEWRKTTEGKIPYLIQLPGAALLAAAGLWESWQAPDGSQVETCTLLTTSANAQLAVIHDRMPVFLDAEGRRTWLAPDSPTPALLGLLKPTPDGLLETVIVSTRVNSPTHDDPQCTQSL
jgi:putative SOS response-associated peptidase YedK